MKYLRYIYLLISSYTPFALAQDVRVVTEEVPNFQIVENGKVVGGVSTEIINAVFKEANLTPAYEVLPWLRAVREVEQKPDTFIFSIMRNNEREDKYLWVFKLFTVTPTISALANNSAINITTINDIKNYTIGVSRGDFGEAYLKSIGLIENDNLMLPAKYRHMWKMLFTGRVDAVFTNQLTAASEIKQVARHPDEVIRIMDLPDAQTSLYLATSKKTNPELIEKLQHAYNNITANGQLSAIYAKWQEVFDSVALKNKPIKTENK